MLPPTERFSSRVEYYRLYRPHYPVEFIELLRKEIGLDPSWIVADIGSGTGFSSERFLENGNEVYGIEPNAEMRKAGEEYLKDFPNFHSVDGAAEFTKLQKESVDLAFAGSAFHWFNVEDARTEFHRILKPEGIVAIGRIGGMNQMIRELMRSYRIEAEPPEYSHDPSKYDRFFGKGNYRELDFIHTQILDWNALHGRILSMSYSPLPGHPLYHLMVQDLRKLFEELQRDGVMTIEMRAKVCVGK